jgi:rubrerythrin
MSEFQLQLIEVLGIFALIFLFFSSMSDIAKIYEKKKIKENEAKVELIEKKSNPKVESKLFCSNCGKPYSQSENIKFCPECGNKL